MNATQHRRLVRAAAAALLLAAVPAVSSCGVNFDAQTDQYYTPADGESSREGTVDVLNAMIISDEPGTGRLIAALSNGETEEADTLTGVRGAQDDEDVQVQLVDGDTAIPAGGVLQLADDGSAVVSVSGDPKKVRAGGYVRLAFSFQNGEEAELNVPVLSPGETYGDIDIPSAPSSSDTPETKG